MIRRTRRSTLAAAAATLTSALAGCSGLDRFSDETNVEYDRSAIAALPGDIPAVPPALPVQPTDAHLREARDRIRSLLADTDVSRVPNAVVREQLARERESARAALSTDDEENRVEALAGLTHPRSEAMFVAAGLAAFDGALTPEDVAERRKRQHQDAESFLTDYAVVGPPGDPVGAFAEHARITGWGRTGARLTEPERRHEYQNTVLHVAELAQGVEWGRAYAVDARRLHERYTATLEDPHDYGERFASVAATLVDDVASHATPPDWETLTSDIERDIEREIADTPAAELLEELARDRWVGAQEAVERHEDGHEIGAVGPAMRALTTDRAFTDAKSAVSDGAYGVPESVEPIAAERDAAVNGLRTLLDTAPKPLARRLATSVHDPIRDADRIAEENRGPAGPDLYAQYAVANHLAAAAPAVVRRVGGLFDG